MTMARANWRAVASPTAAMAAPSRRCACQSSGRRSVSVSAMIGILLQVERAGIERVAFLAGEARGERDGLLQRQLREERFEDLGAAIPGRAPRRGAFDHQHELAALAVGIALH